MNLKITEPRKQILIAMYTHNLVLLRTRTRFGTEYNLVKASGQIAQDISARVNKYHMRFLEENELVIPIHQDPISDRLVLTTRGKKVAKLLSRQYNDGAYKKQAVELEIK
jgi:hypothetical protein